MIICQNERGGLEVQLVSVIVPVYNVEKYLQECIESLLGQTYSNLELILVDDGSKDSSGIICDKYAKVDSRIKVIHKKNEGLGLARNSGLEIATGEFVTFVDADDKADKNLVELLMKAIKSDSADTSIGGFKRISENGKIEFQEKYRETVYQGNSVYDELFSRMLGSAPDRKDAIRMSVWNVLYSMTIIREFHLRFPSEREFISEDIIWDSEYYKHSCKVKVITSTAYNYRITPGSLTQKYKTDRFQMVCKLYKEMCYRIGNDEEKKQRLQRQFFVNLRSCLRQEKSAVSNKKNDDIKKAISYIVSDSTTSEVSNQYLKIIKQSKQKLFVWLVASKNVRILYYLVRNNCI